MCTQFFNKLLVIVVLTFTISIAELAFAKEKNPQPNILIVLTDDQGWGDVGFNGNLKIDTPNIDSLARDGVSFERFYVNPVCAPTRASILTGRHYLRTGVHGVTRGAETMRSEEVTIAETLRDAGYKTGAFGKWHNGGHYPHTAIGQGFDEFFGFSAGHWSQYFDSVLSHNGEEIETQGYIGDVITDQAITFIRDSGEAPFLAFIAYNTPHSPYQIADSYFDKYSSRGLNARTSAIYGMVENIDDNLGRLFNTLSELKLRDDTIIVFLSDNGPHIAQGEDYGPRYNGGMRDGKGSVHEGGVRVPLFIHWPQYVDGGRIVHQPGQHIDLYPTLIALAGLEAGKQKRLDGIDLSPILRGEDRALPDRMIFSHKWSFGDVVAAPGAVRTQRWVAILEGDRWSLYDIVNDVGETVDIASKYPEVIKRLSRAYYEWFEDVSSAGFAPIPIELGHGEFPQVVLPAAEALLSGTGIRYAGGHGWAHAWITDWTDTSSFPHWQVKVMEPGYYRVRVSYAAEEYGSELRIKVGGQHLDAQIGKAHVSADIPAPDRSPRYSVFDRKWASLDMGVVQLSSGEQQFSIRALSKAGIRIADIKDVEITRVN